MKLIEGALSRSITVIVAVIAVLFFSVITIRTMKVDIFPKLGLPTIYVAQPYGGLSPEEMEGYVTSYYEYHFLYVTGVKAVESKSIQGSALIKIIFHEGTDMSQAAAEVVGYVNRARAFMPPGTVPPFITRFDAGSVPVGQLVFTSETRTLGDIQDLALFNVRPMFSTLPGVSAPPPFGGNQKTVVVKIDPEKIKSYNFTPEQVVEALADFNTISPAGNVRIGDEMMITPQNSVVQDVKELENIPLKLGAGASVYLKDIGHVELGSDITTAYALVNGARSVYIPVTKRADASTWEVVKRVKAALPDMQSAVPSDIKISYEFDQSGYVINSLKGVLFEGLLGAILTGLMVLLFLKDPRGALIVVLTIPIALLTSLVCLNLLGQTINIMTLGGLALAVGILVDEATVTIENIHRHLESGKQKARAVLDGCKEIVFPKMLILFSILAVFIPSFFMSGVPKGMFMPMAMAVGFAMIASFLLSMTFVPVIAVWILKPIPEKNKKDRKFEALKSKYRSYIEKYSSKTGLILTFFFLVTGILLTLCFFLIGTDIFPSTDTGQVQVRLRLKTGTRLERTEEATQQLLKTAGDIIGKENIAISSAFVGTQPSSYPVNLIHLWTSGPHESVTKINFKEGVHYPVEKFKEELRARISQQMPDAVLSFEPANLVDQVLNLGSTNPIELAVLSKDLGSSTRIAGQLLERLKPLPYLRDVQIATPLNYPALKINIDRVKSGQMGVTVKEITQSLVTATSSSRFVQPNYWRDPSSGTAYQVQVEFPQYLMDKAQEIESVPIVNKEDKKLYLRDVAAWNRASTPGEYDRLNQQRFLTLTANVHQSDLGGAVKGVQQAIADLGKLPAGMKILQRGQAELLGQTMNELQIGLIVAIIVIFLMLTANFQSFRVSLVTLSIVPAVILGSFLMLLITGNTLNIQSYMGTIMAIGVAIANAILMITNGENLRREGHQQTYLTAASNRLRPIMMTSIAMIAGMVPMSIGISEGGDQIAPLGIAVIGGLLFSMISTLLFLPLMYKTFVGKHVYKSMSLNPDDKQSQYFDNL